MLTPITAVTAADPYPWYADLVRDRPLDWHDGLRLWVSSVPRPVRCSAGWSG